MSISPRPTGVGGVIVVLLIMHQVILTYCVRGPFSATHISFSDQIPVRMDGDTNTLVVHEKPTTPSSPSPSPSPGLAIIARGVGFLNPPSKVKIHHRGLLMNRPPPPIEPICLPNCK